MNRRWLWLGAVAGAASALVTARVFWELKRLLIQWLGLAGVAMYLIISSAWIWFAFRMARRL